MIAEFQFEAPLLRSTVREATATEVVVEQLDASGEVPLRTVCWLENGDAGPFEQALSDDRTVDRATRVVDTARGTQYDIKSSQQFPEAELYYAAVEESGLFVSGVRGADSWEVQMRFPDRDALGAFRDQIERTELSVQAIHQWESAPRADRYGISDAQQEILHLASQRGYFDVPRQASLADLAEDLDVSSQAASERLRRGLDSLVERALLPSE